MKLLLLGAGESGKSTFLKQMRIIHGYGFDPESLQEYKRIIYQNVVRGVRVLVDARDKLGIPWGSEDNAPLGSHVMKFETGGVLDTRLFLDYLPILRELWADQGIRTAFSRRREYQLVSVAEREGYVVFLSGRGMWYFSGGRGMWCFSAGGVCGEVVEWVGDPVGDLLDDM